MDGKSGGLTIPSIYPLVNPNTALQNLFEKDIFSKHKKMATARSKEIGARER